MANRVSEEVTVCPSMLSVGLDPALAATSPTSRAVFPNLDAESIRADVAAGHAELQRLGFRTDVCHLDLGATAEVVYRETLRATSYDYVVIGAAVRLDPTLTHLFEMLVDVTRELAPRATLVFDTDLTTTVDAVGRWHPRATPSPSTSMTRLLGGFMIAQALYAAARLDVLTHLDDGSLPVGELARRTGTDPDALRRLVRALAPEGVFTTDGDTVTATPLGATLSRHHPESVYELARFWMETSYLPYSEFTHTLRTGEAAATRYLGRPYADWIASDPERAAQLGRTFAAIGAGLRPDFFAGYDLPDGRVVADIGGADGSNLIDLLARYPDRQGVVLDLPTVVPEARAKVARAGLEDRIEVVSGDFFDQVPSADVYLLSTVLHDWDDAGCASILASIAAAARPGATLVVIEGLVVGGDRADPTKLSDLVMLGIAGGRERTDEEFAALLGAAGFSVRAVIPSAGPYSIIEARSTVVGA